jgi:energy-coupling factor transporter ATP-binding protein EcfA2
MIRKLYIHNFKCFSNFEIHLDDFQLIVGPNGGGKSAFFEILGKLKKFVCEKERIYNAFPIRHTTLGLSGHESPLKLEMEIEDDENQLFFYSLEVEYDKQQSQQRVFSEVLTCNQTPLFKSHLGEAQLYRDDGSAGPSFPIDWSLSGVGFLAPGKDNKKMTWFKNRLSRVWLLRIVPDLINEESRKEESSPSANLSDLADWYRYLVQDQPEVIYELTEALRDRIKGFRALRLKDAGDGKILYVGFENESGSTYHLPFSQLSEGQKTLVGLYTTYFGLFSRKDATLCVDEPENFLSLPEIQPWLDLVYQACEEGGKQCLLISHHPRVVNFLAAEKGIWFERSNGTGPTRIHPITADGKGPISIDQLIERGWIDAGKN